MVGAGGRKYAIKTKTRNENKRTKSKITKIEGKKGRKRNINIYLKRKIPRD